MDASADLLKVNHRLESRVPEIGLLGSEGGATSSVVPTPIDVYTAGGDVLMGTARWQKEAAEQAEHERILAEVEHKRREVALARVELGTRIEALEQELKQKQAEAERWIGTEARRKLDLAKRRKELEHSPSAKIFKKRENSQGAGKKTTPRRRSPKGDGQ